MVSIAFLPVCSRCKSIIYDEVNCSQDEIILMSSGAPLLPYISPFKCPNCGEVFDRIVMPTKLPISTEMILQTEEI